jgi:Phosphotransferase enzyme family
MVAVVDAERLVAELNAGTGIDVRLDGVAALGEVSGAAYVHWPDGHDSVVARSSSSVDWLRFIGEVLDVARAGGALVPRYELIAELADSSVLVQERLPGAPPDQIDHATIDAIVAANETFAGLLRDRPDVPAPELFLRESGQGHCVHETLAEYDDRGRKLLAWIREVGSEAPATLPGEDLVHWDLVPGNVLMDEAGAVTGIVDWDGIGRGDRRFSLMKLRFVLERAAVLRPAGDPIVSASAVARLDERLQDMMELEVFRLCWAHWSLSMVDWAIRHSPRAYADLYLDLAVSRLR